MIAKYELNTPIEFNFCKLGYFKFREIFQVFNANIQAKEQYFMNKKFKHNISEEQLHKYIVHTKKTEQNLEQKNFSNVMNWLD